MRPLLPLSISHRFRRDDEGAVAITFALASITLFLIIGVGVDYGRMVDMRQRISSAVDAASLAAGRAMLDGKLSNSEIADLAAAYFKNNAHSAQKMGTIGKPKIRIDRNSGTVQIDVTSTLAMTVSRVGGIKTLTIPVTSTATYQQSDVEVGMALDITGSMNDTIGGQRKIDALKAAFETFADRVIPDHPIAGHKARIGLAPYSAGINLGSYAGDASNFRSKDGCVTERFSGGATDTTDAFFVAADGTTDVDPTEGSAPYICPRATITPLSSDKDELIADVKAYQLSSSTGGHFGVQWAWNLVSDKWAAVWGGNSAPGSFDQVQKKKLLKAVVLMTDGIFNTAFHGSKSSTQAVALCNAMKAEGVMVFAVGFGLGGDATALKTLQSCASPGPDYFADASNPEELNAAFSQFAGKLSELRISR